MHSNVAKAAVAAALAALPAAPACAFDREWLRWERAWTHLGLTPAEQVLPAGYLSDPPPDGAAARHIATGPHAMGRIETLYRFGNWGIGIATEDTATATRGLALGRSGSVVALGGVATPFASSGGVVGPVGALAMRHFDGEAVRFLRVGDGRVRASLGLRLAHWDALNTGTVAFGGSASRIGRSVVYAGAGPRLGLAAGWEPAPGLHVGLAVSGGALWGESVLWAGEVNSKVPRYVAGGQVTTRGFAPAAWAEGEAQLSWRIVPGATLSLAYSARLTAGGLDARTVNPLPVPTAPRFAGSRWDTDTRHRAVAALRIAL